MPVKPKKIGKGGQGERIVLVRLETTPEDIEGMAAAQGILTVRGGMTSHAAVVLVVWVLVVYQVVVKLK